MYKLFYKKQSIESLKNFINSYKNSFIRLIKDSGILLEEEIIQNYIKIGDKLYESIMNKIIIICSENNILGKNTNNDIKYISISINNFRIFIYYSENNSKKERYIENIEFFKK